ncbi:MAG: class I SAM-dependent methyltransferase [Deltaproteobacteria bacterium]|nr:class I SAM-dependent methyltransferase [Deltaproteobacteria bacterium]MBW2420907.1 class I SAM-dependent methyltransferase [Deltaproteobacteria bacterium]
MPGAESEFAKVQREYFEEAEVDHYEWTTSGPGFAETEDELLEPFLERIEEPCLEMGCGEGNNLFRLVRRARCFGVDLFPKKLDFAASRLPEARLAVADVARMPFADGTFRTVFIRDVLHHVPEPRRVVEEAVRVLQPGGLLCLLEPNARNPIVQLQTRLVAAEAGARVSRPEHIARLLAELPLRDVEITTRQPLPLRRLVYHYQVGFPSLGAMAAPRALVRWSEGLLGKLLPRSRWSYVAAAARRTHA